MSLVNVVLAQGGGPTSVINGSLASAIREYKKHVGDKVDRIYVALHGAAGLLNEDMVDVTDMSDTLLDGLEQTICASAGSSRVKLNSQATRERVIDVLEKHNIHVLNLIGGGDTASTVAEINKVADEKGYNLISEHIMKTVDNDGYGLFSPGWGTIGMWQRDATLSFIKEVEAMPGVVLGVSMGRDSGWITAMTAHAFQAEGYEKRHMHRMYTPETGFDLDRFVEDCCRAYKNSNGKLVVSVSEGVQETDCEKSLHERLVAEESTNRDLLSRILTDTKIIERFKHIFDGPEHAKPLHDLIQGYAGVAAEGAQLDDHGNIAYGEIRSVNLADWLAGYLQVGMSEKLGIKKLRVRGNTFGYMQRCPPTISPVDLHGAKLVGQKAAEYAIDLISGGGGHSQVNKTYGTSIVLTNEGSIAKNSFTEKSMKAKAVKLNKIANLETGYGIQYTMPKKLMGPNGPTQVFLDYSGALVNCDALKTEPTKYVTLTDRKLPAVEKLAPAWGR